jgi:hypothetical protein
LLDTNLLLLFIVGTASPEYINKHKKLTEFSIDDYDLLKGIISMAPEVLLTPNTLTETSNLAAYIANPAKIRIFEVLQQIIQNSNEHYIESCTAADRHEFIRLGLTDAALIEASTDKAVVLTADLDLYLATLSQGSQALNFNHLRDQNM